jgi:Spy/CpxP family protein refolding chaperone
LQYRQGGENTMSRFLNTVLLGATLLSPLTISTTALRAKDNPVRYHDAQHNDDHEWNNREDRAYRIWAKENHRKYRAFSKLKDDDRQNYWNWRHEHSDALLKIDIR